MTPSRRPPAPSRYRLQVDGHLGAHWASSFDGFAVTHDPDGTTTLVGDVADQAQLHGLLDRVRDLGVTLVCVEVEHPPSDGR